MSENIIPFHYPLEFNNQKFEQLVFLLKNVLHLTAYHKYCLQSLPMLLLVEKIRQVF